MEQKITLQDIAIVIVLYGKNLVDTDTYKGLLVATTADNLGQMNLVVYDNSLEADSNINTTDLKVIKYFHDPSNPGVSHAYNYAAEFAKQQKMRWLILFDQDTKITNGALEIYIRHINEYQDIRLFSPMLISNNYIVSPSIFKNRRGRSIKSLTFGLKDFAELSPLNSGIAISLATFFKVGGYNESVPLDYSDYAFIDRVKNHVDRFFLLPLEFDHGLSSFEKPSLSSSLFRFESLCKGLINTSENRRSMRQSFLVAGRRAARLTFKYKNPIFIKVLMQKFLLPGKY
ncbi:glycosyltransferase [Pedobacter frigiditerrae]|uniref:glycosyltransferase n=1 Tax=Pedobacter frigiditerrae TaxID=2530452 RepID=UPI002931842B|nr:glycosyltransferase [Pedobacter frigiditerrae]